MKEKEQQFCIKIKSLKTKNTQIILIVGKHSIIKKSLSGCYFLPEKMFEEFVGK